MRLRSDETMLRIACLFTLIAFGLGGRFVHADPLRKPTRADALEHFNNGVAQYTDHKWQAAVDEFKKSVYFESAPASHFNLAQSYKKLAETEAKRETKKSLLSQAVYHYRVFLRTTAKTPEFDSRANTNIAAIEADLEQMKLDEEAEAKARTSSAETSAPIQQSPQPLPNAATPVRANHHRDGFALVLIGTGAAGGLVGGGLYWSAVSLRNDADATADQAMRNDLRARADTRALSGAIVGGAGVVLIGVGVLKLVLDSEDSSSSSTAWTVSPSSNGVVVLGSF